MIKRLLTLVFLTGALSANLHAQTPGEEELGAWFMYFGTNQIAERFDCLSFTIEMPFKDNDDIPNERYGWSAERSMSLGASVLQPVLFVIDDLI